MSGAPQVDLSALVAYLLEQGFVSHSQVEHYGEKGRDYSTVLPIPNLIYLHRAFGTTHQYIGLVTYLGALCEAVCETYGAPKITRQPKGFGHKVADLEAKGYKAKDIRLARTMREIQAFCELSA